MQEIVGGYFLLGRPVDEWLIFTGLTLPWPKGFCDTNASTRSDCGG